MKLLLVILFGALSLNATIFDKINVKIDNVTPTSATINMGNLHIGESGVIIHQFDKKNSMILTNATVISSDSNTTTLKFIDNIDILKQDALPTTTLKPQNNDSFILHHLYNTSILFVPNFQAQSKIKQLYPQQNFIDIDIFAAILKIDSKPTPSKEDIQKYSIKNNIGTIFFYVDDYIYIVDTISFKIIDKVALKIDDKTQQKPFFTNVQNIKSDFFSFGKKKIDDFNKYYANILGIKK